MTDLNVRATRPAQLAALCLLAVLAIPCRAQQSAAPNHGFRVGAAVTDISPTSFPVRIVGGFLESQATQVVDPLFARCFVLDDGKTKIVLAIVDSCGVPHVLIDTAKREASMRTGIPSDHMLVSATHTHSAPAAWGGLGTRQDEAYAARLPGLIADGIVAAVVNLQPARIGWATIDDWEHTHNRRWIRHANRLVEDPFGSVTGRANMHPGHLSPDVIGPSGPVDPALSVLAAQTLDGKPLALLANYSQHYFGAGAVSADYYGDFCRHVANLWGQPGNGNGPFVCAMSQGTSGDCMWMDYGAEQEKIDRDGYARAVAQSAHQALRKIVYQDSAPLAIVEKRLTLKYRVPSPERLAWARPIAAKIENDLPRSIPEVYANEALFLHERQQSEVTLQAMRIGDLTICAIPNEVYALSGLKLRARSPAAAHFNIALANGAEGYIPPPEQHALGGYTTWPAQSAGLEVEAEPKIVAALVEALAEVTGKRPQPFTEGEGPYSAAMRRATPRSWWRLNDAEGTTARNAVDGAPPAELTPGFAWYLPGVGSGTGTGRREQLTPSAFSGPNHINRAVHLAGGDLRATVDQLGRQYSVALWFWLGEPSGASERSGTIFQGPGGELLESRQSADHRVRLLIGDVASTSMMRADGWQFVVLLRDGDELRVYLNGHTTAEMISEHAPKGNGNEFLFGKDLQGKLDEIAIFDRLLTPDEIHQFWTVSGVSENRAATEPTAAAAVSSKPESEATAPIESLKKLHVPHGFRVELAASEPQVLDPVAFDWDAGGRLWVVEMADYPLGMDGQGKAGGRVRVLEDRDGDGQFEQSRIFAADLNFPNGILTWRDGVLISAAPEILFLRDTNGDGEADSREVLIRGFHEGNQQLRVNGLRWGLDNWVYCANGGHHAGYGVETKVESLRSGMKLDLGSRDFRFRPSTGAIELESGPTQFGRNRDAWGHWFGTQNVNPLWHYVLADRYSSRNPYVPTPPAMHHVVGPGSPRVYPASSLQKRYHSFNHSGRFTSACGGMIYNDDLLFGEGAAQHAFTCEPFHNLVQHNVIEDAGVSFVSHRAPGEEQTDFFASEDRWCRPVMARTGPDGALWVADMYRYMIEHPDWLPENGKAELLPHYRLGEQHGRIYRVVAESAPLRSVVRLDALDVPHLVAALDSPNDWQRDKVQQLLLWKNDAGAVRPLEQLVRSHPRPQTRLQALCTLDGLGKLQSDLLCTALADQNSGVRENGLRISAAWVADADVVAAASRLVDDPDAKVRIQLALSLGDWPVSDAAAALLAQIAIADADQPFIVAAVMSSALPYAKTMASQILRAESPVIEVYREPLLRLALGVRDHAAAAEILAAALASDEAAAIREFTILLNALERTGTSWQELGNINSAPALTTALADAERLFERAQAISRDQRLAANERIAAATLLCVLPDYREDAVRNLASWLRPQIAPDAQASVLAALSRSGADAVPDLLGEAWAEFSPALRELALDVWLLRGVWTDDLLERIDRGEITGGQLDPARRDRLLHHPSQETASRAAQVLNPVGSTTRAEAVAKYQSVLELTGDVERAKSAFQRACAACHRRADQGADIGPNLATVLSHPPEKLLINILDPNAEILPGYQRYNCLLETGKVVSGLLTAETSNSITIKSDKGELHTLARSQIETLQNSNLSLMPEGLEKVLQPQELADIIALLRTPPTSGDSNSASPAINALDPK